LFVIIVRFLLVLCLLLAGYRATVLLYEKQLILYSFLLQQYSIHYTPALGTMLVNQENIPIYFILLGLSRKLEVRMHVQLCMLLRGIIVIWNIQKLV